VEEPLVVVKNFTHLSSPFKDAVKILLTVNALPLKFKGPLTK